MNFLKNFVVQFVCSYLIIFLVVAPVMEHLPVKNNHFSRVVWADDGGGSNGDCEQGSDGCDTPDIDENYYETGDAFNEVHRNIDRWQGADIINYLLIVFTSLGVSTFATVPDTFMSLDCPTNTSYQVTVPLTATAAVVQISSEIIQAGIYKSFARKAAKKVFDRISLNQARTSGDQVEGGTEETSDTYVDTTENTFNELIDVMEKMKKSTKAKLIIHSILSAAYLSGAGVEVGNIVACKAKCSTTYSAANTLYSSGITAMGTANNAAILYLAALQASNATVVGGIATSTIQGACIAALPLMSTDIANITGFFATSTAVTTEFQTRILSDDELLRSESLLDLASPLPGTSRIRALSLYNTILGNSTTWQTSTIAQEAAVQTARGPILATNICAPHVQAYIAGRESAVNGMFNTKVECCGGVPIKGFTTLPTSLPNSIFPSRNDININGNQTVFNYQPEDLKNLFYSSIMHHALKNEFGDLIKKTDAYKRFIAIHDSALSASEEIYKIYKKLEYNKETKKNDLAIQLKKVLNEFRLIPSAHAEDKDKANAAADVLTKLGIGAGMLALAFAKRDVIRSVFLAKPKSRTIYYSMITAALGVRTGLDAAALKKIKDDIDTVKKEKQNYLDAISGGGESGEDGGDGGGDDIDVSFTDTGGSGGLAGGMGPDGKIDCKSVSSKSLGSNARGEVRKDDTVSAACNIIGLGGSRNPFNLPRNPNLNRNAPSMQQAMALTGLMSEAMGAGPDHEGFASGRFGDSANNINRAMRNILKKREKDLDALVDQKDKNGKKMKFNDMINGMVQGIMNPGGAASSPAMASLGGLPGSSANDDEEEEGEEEGSGVIGNTLPGMGNYQAPNTETDAFDFGMGGEDEYGVEAAANKAAGFENYNLDYDDVSPKKSVSIFKLLSNRYLLNYDTLLDRKVSKKKSIEVKKPAAPTKKDELKKMLNK